MPKKKNGKIEWDKARLGVRPAGDVPRVKSTGGRTKYPERSIGETLTVLARAAKRGSLDLGRDARNLNMMADKYRKRLKGREITVSKGKVSANVRDASFSNPRKGTTAITRRGRVGSLRSMTRNR